MENLNLKQKIVLGVIAVAMLIAIGYYFMQEMGQEEQEFETYENLGQEEKVVEVKKEIKVHVAGCVAEEGVVTLNEGDRITDAIEKAGGLTLDANTKDVNLAYPLKDGQKLYIPSNIEEEVAYVTSQNGEEIISTGSSINEKESTSGKININTATQTALETLSRNRPLNCTKNHRIPKPKWRIWNNRRYKKRTRNRGFKIRCNKRWYWGIEKFYKDIDLW